MDGRWAKIVYRRGGKRVVATNPIPAEAAVTEMIVDTKGVKLAEKYKLPGTSFTTESRAREAGVAVPDAVGSGQMLPSQGNMPEMFDVAEPYEVAIDQVRFVWRPSNSIGEWSACNLMTQHLGVKKISYTLKTELIDGPTTSASKVTGDACAFYTLPEGKSALADTGTGRIVVSKEFESTVQPGTDCKAVCSRINTLFGLSKQHGVDCAYAETIAGVPSSNGVRDRCAFYADMDHNGYPGPNATLRECRSRCAKSASCKAFDVARKSTITQQFEDHTYTNIDIRNIGQLHKAVYGITGDIGVDRDYTRQVRGKVANGRLLFDQNVWDILGDPVPFQKKIFTLVYDTKRDNSDVCRLYGDDTYVKAQTEGRTFYTKGDTLAPGSYTVVSGQHMQAADIIDDASSKTIVVEGEDVLYGSQSVVVGSDVECQRRATMRAHVEDMPYSHRTTWVSNNATKITQQFEDGTYTNIDIHNIDQLHKAVYGITGDISTDKDYTRQVRDKVANGRLFFDKNVHHVLGDPVPFQKKTFTLVYGAADTQAAPQFDLATVGAGGRIVKKVKNLPLGVVLDGTAKAAEAEGTGITWRTHKVDGKVFNSKRFSYASNAETEGACTQACILKPECTSYIFEPSAGPNAKCTLRHDNVWEPSTARSDGATLSWRTGHRFAEAMTSSVEAVEGSDKMLRDSDKLFSTSHTSRQVSAGLPAACTAFAYNAGTDGLNCALLSHKPPQTARRTVGDNPQAFDNAHGEFSLASYVPPPAAADDDDTTTIGQQAFEVHSVSADKPCLLTRLRLLPPEADDSEYRSRVVSATDAADCELKKSPWEKATFMTDAKTIHVPRKAHKYALDVQSRIAGYKGTARNCSSATLIHTHTKLPTPAFCLDLLAAKGCSLEFFGVKHGTDNESEAARYGACVCVDKEDMCTAPGPTNSSNSRTTMYGMPPTTPDNDENNRNNVYTCSRPVRHHKTPEQHYMDDTVKHAQASLFEYAVTGIKPLAINEKPPAATETEGAKGGELTTYWENVKHAYSMYNFHHGALTVGQPLAKRSMWSRLQCGTQYPSPVAPPRDKMARGALVHIIANSANLKAGDPTLPATVTEPDAFEACLTMKYSTEHDEVEAYGNEHVKRLERKTLTVAQCTVNSKSEAVKDLLGIVKGDASDNDAVVNQIEGWTQLYQFVPEEGEYHGKSTIRVFHTGMDENSPHKCLCYKNYEVVGDRTPFAGKHVQTASSYKELYLGRCNYLRDTYKQTKTNAVFNPFFHVPQTPSWHWTGMKDTHIRTTNDLFALKMEGGDGDGVFLAAFSPADNLKWTVRNAAVTNEPDVWDSGEAVLHHKHIPWPTSIQGM